MCIVFTENRRNADQEESEQAAEGDVRIEEVTGDTSHTGLEEVEPLTAVEPDVTQVTRHRKVTQVTRH